MHDRKTDKSVAGFEPCECSDIGSQECTPKKLRVAVWVGMIDKKCLEHLKGLHDCDLVGSGILFRSSPVQGLEKFHQICPPAFLRSSTALSHLYALLVTIPWCLRFQPHVCIGIGLAPHSILAKLGQMVTKAKFINWFKGTDMYVELAYKWWGRLLRRPMAGAAFTLTMGTNSNKMLESMGWSRDRLLVGRNDYDFSDYDDNAGGVEKQWDIIYSGRLDRYHKRLGVLLHAVSELRASHPGVRCAIVGEGPDRDRLESIHRSLGLESQVEFLGHQSDIPGLLNRSRILVMTSAWEGLPSSIVEAFACGIPVVAANVGDISDLVVNGDNGILVDSAGTAGDYAGAVRHLLESPDEYRRMSLSAKQTGDRMRKEIERGVSTERWRCALKLALGSF